MINHPRPVVSLSVNLHFGVMQRGTEMTEPRPMMMMMLHESSRTQTRSYFVDIVEKDVYFALVLQCQGYPIFGMEDLH